MDPGGIQAWVGLKNRFGGGAVFFGDGVNGFAGADGVGGRACCGEGSPAERDQKEKLQAAHGNAISGGRLGPARQRPAGGHGSLASRLQRAGFGLAPAGTSLSWNRVAPRWKGSHAGADPQAWWGLGEEKSGR